jgi:hypothetical protein
MGWLAGIHTRRPWVLAALIALLTALASLGLKRVEFKDDPRAKSNCELKTGGW